MWRPDRSAARARPAHAARHRAAQPGVRRRLHRPLQPGRPRRRAGAPPQHPGLALRARGRGRRRHDLARRGRTAGGLQHGAPVGARRLDGTARRAARPPGRGARLARWCGSASTGSKGRVPRTIGLETMPRTVENIGFYSRIGLVPGHADRDPGARCAAAGGRPARAALGVRSPARRERIEECRQPDRRARARAWTSPARSRSPATSASAIPRWCASRASSSASRSGTRRRSPPGGPRTRSGCSSWWRASLSAFERLLDALHGTAAAERVGRLAIRCQTEYADAYLRLIAAGLPGALDRPADDPPRVSAARRSMGSCCRTGRSDRPQ